MTTPRMMKVSPHGGELPHLWIAQVQGAKLDTVDYYIVPGIDPEEAEAHIRSEMGQGVRILATDQPKRDVMQIPADVARDFVQPRG